MGEILGDIGEIWGRYRGDIEERGKLLPRPDLLRARVRDRAKPGQG
jgi:hypothetical protein